MLSREEIIEGIVNIVRDCSSDGCNVVAAEREAERLVDLILPQSPTQKELCIAYKKGREDEAKDKPHLDKFIEELKTTEETISNLETVDILSREELEVEYKKGFKFGRKREDEFRNKLEDVVNELDLSECMIEEHGQHGTAPSELVRLVLEEKDRKIFMLSNGFKDISNTPKTQDAWVDVNDRLPETFEFGDDMLIFVYQSIVDRVVVDTYNGSFSYTDVTKWMYVESNLPKPPTGESIDE